MERMTKIIFAEEKIKQRFEGLKYGDNSKRTLHKYISQAIKNIKTNPYCTIRIPYNLIPRYYLIRYGIKNLFKYDLPSGWRLLYSVTANEIEIVAILLEYLTHKDYEKRFNYVV
jgi:hypothetical protein